jgi:hypothetical protein
MRQGHVPSGVSSVQYAETGFAMIRIKVSAWMWIQVVIFLQKITHLPDFCLFPLENYQLSLPGLAVRNSVFFPMVKGTVFLLKNSLDRILLGPQRDRP